MKRRTRKHAVAKKPPARSLKPWERDGLSRSAWYRKRGKTRSPGDVRRAAIAGGPLERTAAQAVQQYRTHDRVPTTVAVDLDTMVMEAVVRDRNEQATAYLNRLLANRKAYEIVTMSGTVAQFLAVLHTLQAAGFGRIGGGQ